MELVCRFLCVVPGYRFARVIDSCQLAVLSFNFCVATAEHEILVEGGACTRVVCT